MIWSLHHGYNFCLSKPWFRHYGMSSTAHHLFNPPAVGGMFLGHIEMPTNPPSFNPSDISAF